MPAPSINQIIRDETLKRAILWDALLRRHLNLIFAIFSNVGRDIDLEMLSGGGGAQMSELTRAQVLAKVSAIRKIFDAAVASGASAIELAASESGQAAFAFWDRQLAASMPDFFTAQMGFGRMSPDLVFGIGQKDVLGLTPSSWSFNQRRGFARQALLELTTAQGFGETVHQAAKRLTSIQIPMGLAEKLGRRAAIDMARTAFISAAARVENAFMARNRDILAGDTHLATLDSNTCQVCGGLDGVFYPIGAPKPSIPIHNRCRCVYSPSTKTWQELGFEFDEVPPAFRASMNGPVTGATSYDDWIRGLSAEDARDILGPGRYDIWVARGRPPIGDFTSGDRILTLDELV